jgi:hypothetical protein
MKGITIYIKKNPFKTVFYVCFKTTNIQIDIPGRKISCKKKQENNNKTTRQKKKYRNDQRWQKNAANKKSNAICIHVKKKCEGKKWFPFCSSSALWCI